MSKIWNQKDEKSKFKYGFHQGVGVGVIENDLNLGCQEKERECGSGVEKWGVNTRFMKRREAKFMPMPQAVLTKLLYRT